jgi:hypothetical protein
MQNAKINNSISFAVLIKVAGTSIATAYAPGAMMNNPAQGYGICRFTAFSGTGGTNGTVTITDGVATLSDTTFGAFTASMVGMTLSLSKNNVFIGYYQIATNPDTNTVTLATNPSAGTGYEWNLIAMSNGVPLYDVSCYRDSDNNGQGDAAISFGFQAADTVTIVPVYGVHNSDGSLNWHLLAKEEWSITPVTTDAGITIVVNTPN